MYTTLHRPLMNQRLNNNFIFKFLKSPKSIFSTLLVLLFLLFNNYINAQVAVTATAEDMQLSVATLSVPFTVAAGSDRLLLVSVGGDVAPSSVTFGATSMTQVASSTTYTLVLGTSVTVNSGTITVTTASAGNLLAVNAIAFTGVDQTTPVDTPVDVAIIAGATSSNSSIASNVNDLVFDGVIIGCTGFGGCPLSLTETVGQTIQNDISASAIFGSGLGKTSTKAGAAMVNVEWTISGATLGGNHTITNIRSSIALPVELINFDAQSLKKDVILSWETLSETNNRVFEVEKSTDGYEYKNIGSIAGQGTTSKSHRYNFTDESPSEKLLYYRLKQIDFDGQYEYSKVVVVKPNDDDFLIYPNPITDKIFIKNPFLGISTINIYNNIGVLVQKITIDNDDTSFDLSHLSQGVYFLEIYNKHRAFFQKITKL